MKLRNKAIKKVKDLRQGNLTNKVYPKEKTQIFNYQAGAIDVLIEIFNIGEDELK